MKWFFRQLTPLYARRAHFRMPSIETAMPTGACEHPQWEYLERQPGETYTGYCERCTNCGLIQQIVQ